MLGSPSLVVAKLRSVATVKEASSSMVSHSWNSLPHSPTKNQTQHQLLTISACLLGILSSLFIQTEKISSSICGSATTSSLGRGLQPQKKICSSSSDHLFIMHLCSSSKITDLEKIPLTEPLPYIISNTTTHRDFLIYIFLPEIVIFDFSGKAPGYST